MGDAVNLTSGIEDESNKYYHEGGKLLSRPLPGDEIVISGMAGVFPSSTNICELRKNLFNKVDMVGPNTRWGQWSYHQQQLPSCCGLISGLQKYDAGYFGVHERQGHSMDPMARIFHEKAIEAILDAGLHPSELQGTRTGVYVSVYSSENEKAWYYDNLSPQTFAVTGCERSMIAHRLSYFLKLRGPSVVLDSACSSSCYALENAYRAIRLGEIETAIVGGTHICLQPLMTLQFLQLGTLCMDGCCKSFDVRANGYVRSEGIAVIVLQKAKDSKRTYAQVVHAKTNCDGFKEQGITFPSKHSQMDLLSDFYRDCDVDRFSLSFLEAHGTGTKAGDPQECDAIDNILISGRKKPLLIGSLKSNMGHTEATAGLCSIIKCVLAMETGYIPPNIHFETPNDKIRGLVEGRMKVVVDKTSLEEKNALIAVNCYGIGGANAHVLLRRNLKRKSKSKDNLPRLVCVSGRTEEAVTALVDQIDCNGMDAEYIKLLHEVFRKNIQNHLYRGYTIVSQCGGLPKTSAFCPEQGKSLYLAFGELNDWYEIGRQLMILPKFHDSILMQDNLTNKDISLSNVLLGKQMSDKDFIPVLGPVAVQIALVHVLNSINLECSGSIGSSVGELVSAYYNNALSLDETIDCTCILNRAILEDPRLLQPLKRSHTPLNVNHNDHSSKGNVVGGVLKSLIEELSGSARWENQFKSAGLIRALTKNRHSDIDDMKTNCTLLKIGDFPLYNNRELTIISLFGGNSDHSLMEFLEGIGSLYIKGYNLDIDKLYPRVDFPVSRGTPMISPYIRWNHSAEWFVPQFHLDHVKQTIQGIKHYKIDLADPQWACIAGHVIGGRVLFPATGYLYLVWETFAIAHGVLLKASRVSLRNCKFIRATSMSTKGTVVFTVSILSSGEFEVVESNSTVVTGTINFLPKDEEKIWNFASPDLTEFHGKKLSKKEVYKELRLRGYHYSGEFRMIEEYDFNTSMAYVKWQDNWITFMDNVMQAKILQNDSRLLQVPIFISQVNIAADVHCDWVRETFEETAPLVPVYSDITTGEVRCGGVTISGIAASTIAGRKSLKRPLLDTYEFVPNFTELDLYKSVRVNVQIVIENMLVRKFRAVELVDEYSNVEAELLTPIIQSTVRDEPHMQHSLKILSANILDVDVEVEDKRLETESNAVLVIASKVIQRPEVIKSAFMAVKDSGFVMSRESHCCNIKSDVYPDIIIVTMHKTPSETILLLRKKSPQRKTHACIEINSSENFSWLAKTQDAMSKNLEEDLILHSNNPTSGILGLVNSLRKDSTRMNVRCVFIMTESEKFNPNCGQLKRNMAINVYQGGQWGTFRYLLLEGSNIVENEHSFVNVTSRGDLSSLSWIQGPLKHNTIPESEKELVHVYYSSINFKDVMIASGKINIDSMISNRLEQGFPLGFDFSGKNRRGCRVMGISPKGCLSNLLVVDESQIYCVPDGWTLEEAATVPVVYITAIYALIMRGRMKKGESILIHSGTGGVGQAAINLALQYGCKVFTTVGNSAKRDFIKTTYPELTDENIGNSHDESFEQMVYKGTNGRGVDMVLNSLAEDQLVASVRCLATGGRFLEIGKFDMLSNNHLSLLLFKKEATFQGVMLDQIYEEHTKCEIGMVFQKLIREGGVKPLNRKIFRYDEIEQAFRFMASGKHMGKVLVKVRESEEHLVGMPPKHSLRGIARYYCDPQKVYIIVGGLGGFGLELADWLVLRGARKLVLTSRKGMSTGYQHYRVRLWESYGVTVKISTAPVATREGCEQLLEEGSRLGRICAIFNLALVLDDAIFENHTLKSFTATFEPKAIATRHLDNVTRTICPDLKDFVVFSSCAVGRSNIGQTNYAMANSVMEMICEKRKRDRFPALAIEWGAIGDVGVLAETIEDNNVEVGGTSQQSISSCLQVLDTLLIQREASIVSSIVVPNKQEPVDNVVDALINILGLRHAKYVSLHSTLPELGMDSMTTIEAKLTLEKDFGIFLSTKDLRGMNLARLKKLQEEKLGLCQNNAKKNFEIEMIFKLSAEDLDSKISSVRVVPELDENSGPAKVVLFPGIDGFASVFGNLTNVLDGAVALQYPVDGQTLTVSKIVESLAPVVEKLLTKDEPFTIVGYSFGVLIATEIVNILESKGYTGTMICIDGAPLVSKTLIKNLTKEPDHLLQITLICQLLCYCIPHGEVAKHKMNICKCQTWENKVNLAVDLVKKYAPLNASYLGKAANTIYKRIKCIDSYVPSYRNLRSNVKLFKATASIIQNIVDDYGLSTFFEKPVEIRVFEGNHETILENEKLADAINASSFRTN